MKKSILSIGEAKVRKRNQLITIHTTPAAILPNTKTVSRNPSSTKFLPSIRNNGKQGDAAHFKSDSYFSANDLANGAEERKSLAKRAKEA